MLNIDDSELTPKKYLTSLTLIHVMLLIGQVVFTAVVLFISEELKLNMFETDNEFYVVVPLLAVAGYYAGEFIFKQNLTAIANNNNSLKDKLKGYQVALIIKLALLEGPTLLALVALLLSGNLYFLLIAASLMLYFYLQKPSKDRIVEELKLNQEHRMEFDKVDQLLKNTIL